MIASTLSDLKSFLYLKIMKLTKRKGFNFFRSYFDVYNELENNEDKVAFIDALLNRQFMGVKPTDLKGMSKFAYISQTNSIDSQVKGYEDKTKTKLNPLEDNFLPPTVGLKKIKISPSLQVEEKEKEKEKQQINPEFLKMVCDFFSQTTEPLNRKVWGFMNNLNNNGKFEEFVRQTNAYIKYKKQSDEKIHSWLGYESEWNSSDYVDKLNKITKPVKKYKPSL